MVNNLTASVRYNGKLNIDLNEITMNLVPYPRLHFLATSFSPIGRINKINNHNEIFKTLI